MPTISRNEWTWRAWVLGEADYAGKGARSKPRPDVGYGDFSKGQRPIPKAWKQRLEEFLARRDDHREKPGRKQGPPPKRIPRAKPGQLTAHFNVREFDCHDGRRVPAAAVPALKRLCRDVLEPLRAKFGRCTVMSGYRPADYNRRIGGATFSQHVYELTPSSVAADLIFEKGRPRDWQAEAERLLDAGGIGIYSSFVHVDNRPDRARWSG